MKRIFQVFAMLFITTVVWAQSPQKMSYQAVVRDNTSDLITEQGIGIQVSIVQGTVDGTVVYLETHAPTTNENGLVSIEIGDGTTLDDFSAIDWSDGPYFIKTEIDPTTLGGTSYSITGINQLLGVPYSYYATTAGNVFSGDYNDLTNTPDLTNYDSNVTDDFSGSYNDLTDIPLNLDIDATDDFDGDYTSLTNQPDFTGWDTNDADDFSGSYNDLTDVPENLDIDATDDFDGDYNNLTNQPDFTNWDTNDSDDFDGDYTSLTNQPDFTGWDTNDADDFSGSYNDLTDVPVNLDIDATDDFDGDYNSLTNQPDFTNWDTDVTDDFDGDYTSLTNQPDFTGWDTNAADDFDGDYSSLVGTPTNVSTFTNDAGYLTSELWTENGADIYRNTGNVGIGSTNPSVKLEVNGNIAGISLNTGQGANELYAMDQDVRMTDNVTFSVLNSGTISANSTNMAVTLDGTTGALRVKGGASIAGNLMAGSDITTAGNINSNAINTGQGMTEVYQMNQNLRTTDIVYFSGLAVNGIIQAQTGTAINEFSTDGTLAGDSNTAVPTEKAVKAYVDNAVGTHYLGEEYLDGIVFYLYTGSDGQQHGLIVSKTETTAKWQNVSVLTNADRSWDGPYNTGLMSDSPAKDWITANFSGEWYLPSVDEFKLLADNLFHVNSTMSSGGYTVFTYDNSAEYWTSTENNTTTAYVYRLFQGYYSNGNGKTNNLRVRAIRAF